MMVTNTATNLFKQAEQILNAQKKVATGKRIQRISDDPVGMAKVLDYRRALATIEQYQQNVDRGKMRLEMSETILNDASGLVDTAVNIAVEASTGPIDTRPVLANDVKNIRLQLKQLANNKIGDSHLYAGHKTDIPPYSNGIGITGGVYDNIEFGLAADATDVTINIRNAAGAVVRTINLGDGVTPGSGGSAGVNTVVWDGLDSGGVALPDGQYGFTISAGDAGVDVIEYETYNGDNGDISLVVGDQMSVIINADGDETFGDVFQRLAQLQQALQNPDPVAGTAQAKALIDPLKQASQRIENIRAEGAVMFTHLELTEDRYAAFKLKNEDMLEKTENVDMATAIVELQTLQTAYETSLATAARVLQPTLLDFLR
jgi:flagellar hook-associated protein 3 FlgL